MLQIKVSVQILLIKLDICVFITINCIFEDGDSICLTIYLNQTMTPFGIAMYNVQFNRFGIDDKMTGSPNAMNKFRSSQRSHNLSNTLLKLRNYIPITSTVTSSSIHWLTVR